MNVEKLETKEKLNKLEEQSNQISEDISICQIICVDELCRRYAEDYEDLGVKRKEDLYNFLQLLASDIYQIYFN